MSSESFLAVLFTSVLALFFGYILTVGGYRFFLVLLPVWAFFSGFGLGAQSMQAVFGDSFLATATSWVVGFLLAATFAMLSYLFYFAGVGIVAFFLGYAVGVGLLEAIGFDFGFIAWLGGVALGMGVAVATFAFNIQKYIIIGATSLLGAGVIVGTFLYMFGGVPTFALVQNPVRQALQASPFWFLGFLAIAACGAAAQVVSTRHWEIGVVDRLAELVGEGEIPPAATASQSSPPASQQIAS